MAEEKRKGGLVIADRPQISVEQAPSGDIVITMSRIGDDFATVETIDMTLPADCAEEVANAVLALIKQ